MFFSATQYKLTQNSRYTKDLTLEEIDKLQKMKPELNEFICLFFGLDQGDFSAEQIAELDHRLGVLPDRPKLAKDGQPNLAEVFLSLKNNKQFVENLKLAVKKTVTKYKAWRGK